MVKCLSELLSGFCYSLAGKEISPDFPAEFPDADCEISSLAFDSRAVSAGTLFFALPGTHVHGNAFIPHAVKAGASAVFFQDNLSDDVRREIIGACGERKKTVKTDNDAATDKSADSTQKQTLPVFVRVADTRAAMSPVADAFYDSPSAKLAVIGVTGTEGKSTTVSFVWQFLRFFGKKAGFISTVQYSLGDDAVNNSEHQTTPEAPIIHARLAEMVKNGCEYAVIESSSHGLSAKLNRLGDVRFDAAAMMNVTSEHLEFHGTYEQYKHDKANLFRALDAHDHIKTIQGTAKKVPSFGVVNLDDPASSYFADSTDKTVFGFAAGKLDSAATRKTISFLRADTISSSKAGVSFFAAPSANSSGKFKMHIPMQGEFNVHNTLAAVLLAANILGIPAEKLKPAAEKLKPVKGRMTAIDDGQPFEVIVDYAHTPSSFQAILPPIRERTAGNIICVFGSGGERDVKKRPEQGRIAAQYCDIVILTDEDPRDENSMSILAMIAEGIPAGSKTENESLFFIPDRKAAIRKAFSLACPGDTVLLLGKAHENSIIYQHEVMPYDEIAEAHAALSELAAKNRKTFTYSEERN
ncbi:MAG: UDP-N-acetylmuramyl-tripeptide synthetase [Bacteroides sp.]|nr:UDP-N-acetylmuramyl-tripeptide synthetase [Prevotella sp.]MCM1408757.1 UDP-N-acetylmuramyl-tripeptide synthetase [Treponema brennaborense]MCM1470672.1 UDP-N-acetylmuramyl-tripeptide synthetase [Bacteroides sp.]